MDNLANRRGLDHNVYQPAEDSYLLATTCSEHIGASETVLDVGAGSGIIADTIQQETTASVTGVDINPHACRQTAARGIPVIQSNLLDAIQDSSIDVIVCNPPYLPQDPGPDREDWLSTAVVGGETGREVVELLLHDLDRVLRSDGRAYVLLSSLMDIDQVRETISSHGFTAEEIARDASFPFEVLIVVELHRR